MATMNPKDLNELAKTALSDESAAVELMAHLRWPSGAACPRCGGADPYKLTPKAQPGRPARRGLYKCKACKQQFSVTTGTVFESSHLPLSKWLMAIHLMSASKKGMSAHQLHRMMGVTYKAAWFVMHRLRHAMATNASVFTPLSGTVEADETYVGGRRRIGPTNREDRAKLAMGRPGPNDKKLTPVMAMVERQGRVRLFPIARVNTVTLVDALSSKVDLVNTHLMTDELHMYPKAAVLTNVKRHEMIKHLERKYLKGNIHTNTVEGVFSLLKRGINGTFHHVSKGHLHRYCDEFEFRYNTRTALGYTDGQRAAQLVLGAEGKRLTYKSRSGASAA